MSAPFVLMMLTVFLALITFLVREREKLSAGVAAGGALVLAWFALLAPLDLAFEVMGLSVKLNSAWTILGREIVLAPASRPAVGFLYVGGAFLLGGSWMAKAGRYFPSVGLIMVSILVGSLLVRPFLFAALFLELAAMAGGLILVTRESKAVRGAVRLLVLYSFAMMIILFLGWRIDAAALNNVLLASGRSAAILSALGFGILMAVPPFHLWLPAAAEDANPYGLAFVASLLQSAGLFLLLRSMDSYEWLRGDAQILAGIRILGMGTILLGGLGALVQRSARKVLAYAIVADAGAMVLAVGVGTSVAYQIALGLAGVRLLGLAVGALGIAVETQSDSSSRGGSVIGVLASTVGLLSIAGLPLTAGFPARWGLLRQLAGIDVLGAAAVIAGIGLISLSAMRVALGALESPAFGSSWLSGRGERIFVLVGIGLCVGVGLFPDLTYPLIIRAAEGYVNLIP